MSTGIAVIYFAIKN